MDPKPQQKKMKLKLKRETVRTLDDSALNLLDGVAGGTQPSNSTCESDGYTQCWSECWSQC
jgi:hypothetical protein